MMELATNAECRFGSVVRTFALVLLLSMTAHAQDVPSRVFRLEGHGKANFYFYPDDELRRLTAFDDVVTPHIDWARPLHGGPVRVLAIAHKGQGRWPIELSQRFDFDLTTVYCHSQRHLGSPQVAHSKGLIAQGPADVAARLLQAMNRPIDVIVSDIPFPTLGGEAGARLQELIDRGAGYVELIDGIDLSGYSAEPDSQRQMVSTAVPVAALRKLAKEFGTADEAAKRITGLWTKPNAGRIANIAHYPRDAEPPDENRLQYLDLIDLEQEAWCALIGRSVLWACGRTGAASQIETHWPTEAIERADMPFTLALSQPHGSLLKLRVWDADGRLRHEGIGPAIPQLPAGRYVVGLQAVGDTGVLDWRIDTFVISAGIDIASLQLDNSRQKPGGTIRATATLSSNPSPGMRLRCDVFDNYGRCISTRTRPATREAAFDLPFAESLHIYNYVDLALLDENDRIICEDRRAFYIAHKGPAPDDLNWFVWEAGTGFDPRRRMVLKQLARMGMKGALVGGEVGPAAISAAIANAHPVIYAYRMTGVEVDAQGKANPSFANPDHLSAAIRQIRPLVERGLYLSPLFYYLGDDVRHTKGPGIDFGWGASYRSFLAEQMRKRYRTLDALNQAWGTAYASFDDIAPVKKTDALAALAKDDSAPLCHWIDHQLCADSMIADWWRAMDRDIHELAPHIPSNIGSMVIGWSWPGCGFDFWQLAEGKDLVFQYPNPWVHDIFRSAARRDAYHGTWYGGYGLYNYPPYIDQDYLPWWGLFRNVNLHGLYYGGQSQAYNAERLLGPDLGPVKGVAKIFDNLTELKSGIAKLLFNADRQDDRIAVVYAPENVHTSVIFETGLPKNANWNGLMTGGDLYSYMQSFEGMTSLLSDMGFSYEIIPSAQLTSKSSLSDRWRAIVLPQHLRVTEEQAECLRRFVRAGGTLIADIFPGLLDDRCRADHDGVLADVFGARFGGGIPDKTVVLMQRGTTADQSNLGSLAVDSSVRLDGAQALGATGEGTPIILSNQYGEGRAILFNAMIRDYQIWRTLSEESPWRDAIAALLADEADLKPAIDCQVAALYEDRTHRVQATEFHRYRLGRGEYVAFLRHPKLRPDAAVYMSDLRPKPAWIDFGRTAHVYDVRRGMYRGKTDKVEDVIYPGRAELYALLPYEVRGMATTASLADHALTVEAEIVTGDLGAARVPHVFHIEVFDPQGRIRPELTRNVVGEMGECRERFFLGYNAPSGIWQVKIRDVATRAAKTATVELDAAETANLPTTPARPH
jgi:hypothetical protein